MVGKVTREPLTQSGYIDPDDELELLSTVVREPQHHVDSSDGGTFSGNVEEVPARRAHAVSLLGYDRTIYYKSIHGHYSGAEPAAVLIHQHHRDKFPVACARMTCSTSSQPVSRANARALVPEPISALYHTDGRQSIALHVDPMMDVHDFSDQEMRDEVVRPVPGDAQVAVDIGRPAWHLTRLCVC